VNFAGGSGLTFSGGAGSIISNAAIPSYAPSVDVAALVATNGNCSGTYVVDTEPEDVFRTGFDGDAGRVWGILHRLDARVVELPSF